MNPDLGAGLPQAHDLATPLRKLGFPRRFLCQLYRVAVFEVMHPGNITNFCAPGTIGQMRSYPSAMIQRCQSLSTSGGAESPSSIRRDHLLVTCSLTLPCAG